MLICYALIFVLFDIRRYVEHSLACNIRDDQGHIGDNSVHSVPPAPYIPVKSSTSGWASSLVMNGPVSKEKPEILNLSKNYSD